MINKNLINAFEAVVGKNGVMTAESDLHSYSYDSAVLDPQVPGIVIKPSTTDQLGPVVKLCNDNRLPLTVRGAGTNLSGGTIPNPGGVVLLTNGLNKILEINEEDLYAVVEPGVVTAHFAAQVAKRGLFYPPDPGSQAVSTLGGNVAENAGGLRGLKYGVTKDYVMGIDFYDVDGNLIISGSRTVKSVTGYNLASLMTGSEGTLGVFRNIILKLVPPPKAQKAMMAVFDNVDKASASVAAIIANKIVPCTLEFLDKVTIRYVEDYTKAGLPRDAEAILLIEVDGHPAQVDEDSEKIVEICKRTGALSVNTARTEEEREKLWAARRNALPALARAKPTTVLEDATVPRSQIPAMIKALNTIAEKYKLDIGTFGHAGDGNLHPTILCDKRDKAEYKRVEEAINEIFESALALKGTLSGEHGIGMAKSKWMEKETSPATLEYSLKMKRSIDPNSILNPGKILGDS